MEFNAGNPYGISNDNTPATPRHGRHPTQIMVPSGSLFAPAGPTQQLQQVSQAPQSTSMWTNGQTKGMYMLAPSQHNSHFGNTLSSMQGMESMDNSSSRPSSMASQHFPSYSVPESPMQSDCFQSGHMNSSAWSHKAFDETDFPHLDSDASDLGQTMMMQDENAPVIDLRQFGGYETGGDYSVYDVSARRNSESSFSISSTGAMVDGSNFDELSASEAMSAYASDCDAWSGLDTTPHHLSPLASPARSQDIVKTGSRSHASPSPHTSFRSSPYSTDRGRLQQRWSTGAAPTSTPGGGRHVHQVQDRFSSYIPRLNSHQSLPPYAFTTVNGFQTQTQNVLYSQPQHLQASNASLFPTPDQSFHLEVPRPLPSQGLFRLLQSNGDRHHIGCSSHFADLSDPPDLYATLHDEPSNPPESDMNPSDPDLVPHEQDLRFAGDLYTPRWVRGHGNKREGWCGLCKPGRWLVLKNSAFWYDKSFTHGVSAATGAAFQGPQETRRTEGNLDVWEGLCGSCGEWIALVSSKKKGTTWFRHAYKCHTHPKVKDGPKRRRETSQQLRARAASSASTTSSSANTISKNSTPDSSAANSLAELTGYPIAASSNKAIKTESEASATDYRQNLNGNEETTIDAEYPELVGFGPKSNGLSSLANMI